MKINYAKKSLTTIGIISDLVKNEGLFDGDFQKTHGIG